MGDSCEQHYRLGETLGSGSFAIVKKAVCRSDGSVWAVKCVDRSKLEAEDEEALRIEVEVMQSLRHPHIVQLREVFDTERTFYMVLDLMTGGELFDRVVEKSSYSEAEAASTVASVASALAHIHERGIVHRDLKPENLLYATRDPDAPIKLADFGLAKVAENPHALSTACGTPGYVAPEVLTRGGYGTPSDVWSVGVITYILLCGFPPFYDEDNTVLFEQIKSGVFDFPSPYWDSVSETARDFVRRCLVVDPEARLTAKGVLSHPWVAPFAPRPGSDGAARPPSAAAAGSVSTASLNIAENLRRFNARRKFREGVRKVQALQRFKRFGRMAAKRAAIQLADAAAASRARPASAAAGAAGGAGSVRGGAGAMPSAAASSGGVGAARPTSAAGGLSAGVSVSGGAGPTLRPTSAAAPSRHSLSLPLGGGLYGSGGAGAISPAPATGGHAHRASLPLAGGLTLAPAAALGSGGAVRSPFGGAGPVGVGVGVGLSMGVGLGSGLGSSPASAAAGYSAASAYLGGGSAASGAAGRHSFSAVGAGSAAGGYATGYGSGPAVRRY